MQPPSSPNPHSSGSEESGLRDPRVFRSHPNGSFDCLLCKKTFPTLSKATRHEDTASHVKEVRQMNRIATVQASSPPTSPVQPFTAPAPSSSPFHHSSAPTSPVHSPFSPPPLSTHGFDDAFAHLESFGVSGPALPDDLPNQVYDDWASMTPQAMDIELPNDSNIHVASDTAIPTGGIESTSDSSSLYPLSDCCSDDLACKSRSTTLLYSADSQSFLFLALDPSDPLVSLGGVDEYCQE